MFLNYISTLNLLMHDEESNICAELPLKVRKEMCKMICTHYSDLRTARASLTSIAHVKFAMEVIGESFRLPIEDADTISMAIDIYRAWLLEPESVKPLPMIHPDHKQSFIVAMILHTSLLFEPRTGSIEKHSALCHKVLGVWESFIKDNDGNSTTNLVPETWHVIIKTVLGCADFLLRVPPEKDSQSLGSTLSKHVIKVLYEVFLRSNTDEKDLWVKFASFASQWNHYLCCILTWKAFMLGLNRRVIRLIFGYGTGIATERVMIKMDDNLTLPMSDDKTMFCWLRVIYIIGNPNKINDPQIFLSAMGAIAAFVDMYLDVINNTVTNNTPATPSGPHIQSILKMVGHWLFEAACYGRKAFGEGRGVALATLCKLLCCPTPYGLLKNKSIPKPYLSSIYRAITAGLEEVIPNEVSTASNDDKTKAGGATVDYQLGSDGVMAGECVSAILMNSVPIFSGAVREGSLSLVPLYVSVMEKVLCSSIPVNIKLPIPLSALRDACYNIAGTLLCLPNRYSDLEFINWQNGVAFGTSETVSGAKLPQLNSFTLLKEHLMYVLLEAIHTEKDNVNLAKAINLLAVFTAEELALSPKTIDLSVTAIRAVLQKSDWDTPVYLACFDMFWLLIEKYQLLRQHSEVLVALSEMIDAFVNLFSQAGKAPTGGVPRMSRRFEAGQDATPDRVTAVIEAGLLCMSVWGSYGLAHVDAACAHRVISAVDHALGVSDSFPDDMTSSGIAMTGLDNNTTGIDCLSCAIGVAGSPSSINAMASDNRGAARRIYDAALSCLGDILHFQHQIVSPSGMENVSSFVSEVDLSNRWNHWCHLSEKETTKIYDDDLGIVDCALGADSWVNTLPSREPVERVPVKCECRCVGTDGETGHIHSNAKKTLRDLVEAGSTCACGCTAPCSHDGATGLSKTWFFMLRDGSIMSIVEQGHVEAGCTPVANNAFETLGVPSIGVCPLVAITVRNERGKFVWQASMKYLSTIRNVIDKRQVIDTDRRESMIVTEPIAPSTPASQAQAQVQGQSQAQPTQLPGAVESPPVITEAEVVSVPVPEDQKPVGNDYAGFVVLLKKIRNSHEDVEIVQQVTDKLLERQIETQNKADLDIINKENVLECRGFPKAVAPNLPNRYSNVTAQQQISRLFLSHLGLVNGGSVASQFFTISNSNVTADRKKKQGQAQVQPQQSQGDNRNHRLFMSEPTPALLDTLDLLDRTPSRDRLVVSVLYRADGQNNIRDMISDCRGHVIDHDFVDFVRSLGWPVRQKDMTGVLPPLPAVFPYYADTTLETIFHVPPIGSTIEESGGSVDQHLQAIKNGSVVVMWAGGSEPLNTCPLSAESMASIGSKIFVLVTRQVSSMYCVRLFNVTYDPSSKTVKQVPLTSYRGPVRDHMLLSQFVLGPLIRLTTLNIAMSAQTSDSRYVSPAMRRRALLQASTQYRKIAGVGDTFAEYFKGPACLTNL